MRLLKHRGVLFIFTHLFTVLMLTVLNGVLNGLHADVLTQSASRDQFGAKDFDYFFFEAEDFHDNDPRGSGVAWILSSHEDALLQTVNEEFEADPGAFASGGESITNAYEQSTVSNDVGGEHDVQYLLQFDSPGDYHLYIRHHSPLGPLQDRNKSDSFYYPIEFGAEPLQNKANGDDYGILESMAFPRDVDRRGPWVWFAARQFVDKAEQNPTKTQRPETFQTYSVAEDMIGQDLVFEFDHREMGTMIDSFLFVATDSNLPPTDGKGPDGNGFFGPGDLVDAEFGLLNLGVTPGIPGDFDMDGELTVTDIDLLNAAIRNGDTDRLFDVTADGVVDAQDRKQWVEVLKFTYFGDANLDGEFSTSDFVFVFTAGEYEDDVAGNSTWGQGDWNGDGDFTTTDFVFAFQGGGYEQGPRPQPQAVAVPEPSSIALGIFGLAVLTGMRRQRRR